MRKIAYSMLILLAAAWMPAAAEEILYLKNGSHLPVMSHWVEGDMIHVDLGGNGFMAFPEALVERIDGDTDIKLRPSTVSSRGKMASAGRPSGAAGRDRPGALPVRQDMEIETDKNGMAIYTPLKGQGRAAEKLKQYVLPGRGHVAGQRDAGGFQGAQRAGNHSVIDSGQQREKRRVGIERRYGSDK